MAHADVGSKSWIPALPRQPFPREPNPKKALEDVLGFDLKPVLPKSRGKAR